MGNGEKKHFPNIKSFDMKSHEMRVGNRYLHAKCNFTEFPKCMKLKSETK